MRAVGLDVCNAHYRAPGCDDLPAHIHHEDGREVISTYWQPTLKERERIAKGGVLRLSFLGAMTPCRLDCPERIDP